MLRAVLNKVGTWVSGRGPDELRPMPQPLIRQAIPAHAHYPARRIVCSCCGRAILQNAIRSCHACGLGGCTFCLIGTPGGHYCRVCAEGEAQKPPGIRRQS